MIRPIETNLSLYTADQKAHQMKNDPSAHQFQAMQQDEIVKDTMRQMNTVQKPPESDGGVKIGDRDSGKNKGGGKKKKKGVLTMADLDGSQEDEPEAEESGHLNFLA
ncbi:MAG: hypothetical protein LBQ36_08155 [Synergistaceae bacterium]|jgi:hypothetical protein|nr:hypothetical protein [Synergistaceae bacterium]